MKREVNIKKLEERFSKIKRVYEEQKECIVNDISFEAFIVGFIGFYAKYTPFAKNAISIEEVAMRDIGKYTLEYIKYLNGDPEPHKYV